MEELTSLQQGYYYLSKHQFDEAKLHFGKLVAEECADAHPYIGLLLAENGLVNTLREAGYTVERVDYQ